MKYLKNILLFFVVISGCKAQSPIIDIEDYQNRAQDIHGAYYKDTTNQLNAFEGTYLYTNGAITLKIVLQKKTMSNMNGYYYEDLIIGEYQYINNGIEIINTLDRLNINYADQSLHSISGNTLIVGTMLGCDDCGSTEKRLRIGLSESLTHNWAELDIRRITFNGQPAIKIWVGWQMSGALVGSPSPPRPSFPGGEYILIKQP